MKLLIESGDILRVYEINERIAHIALILSSDLSYFKVNWQIEEIVLIFEIWFQCFQ